MTPRGLDRRLALGLAAVTAVALALRALGLADQPLLADDTGAGATARNFVEHGWPGPMMWHHPRLRDLLVYASTSALGPGPWGLKAWSVLLGTLAAPAAGLLVGALGAGRGAALLAAAIVATDPLHVDFSRQAVNDVYVAFFPVAAIVALLQYSRRRRPWQLVAAGVFLGLGMASKWSTAFPVAAAVALTVPPAVAAAGSRPARWAELALAAASLVLLPAALYVLTFWPWLGRGHDLRELVQFQRAMGIEAATHAGVAGTMLPGSMNNLAGAWRWFLQPAWWVDYVPARAAGTSAAPLPGVANPVTWLVTLPAALWAGRRWLREREGAAGIVLLLWLAAYLPFAAVPRQIFANSAVVVVPFWAALVGVAAARAWERARVAVVAWAAAAAVIALLLCLPATGRSFGPSEALVRAIVPPDALDPSRHPPTPSSGLEVDP